MDDHPGIVFRDGPTGRRAGLAAGPDVWELVGAVRSMGQKDEAALLALAESINLTLVQVRTALGYYADHADEIDERIRRNEEEAAAAESRWRREQAALA